MAGAHIDTRYIQTDKQQFASIAGSKKEPPCGGSWGDYRTYSMTTQRLGSTPVEWVVMLSISWRAA